MKLSTKKIAALYRAIEDEIVDYRIVVMKERKKTFTPERVEEDLFYLMNRVWSNVQKTLGIRF